MWILESWKENLMKMQVERNKSRKRKNKKNQTQQKIVNNQKVLKKRFK